MPDFQKCWVTSAPVRVNRGRVLALLEEAAFQPREVKNGDTQAPGC